MARENYTKLHKHDFVIAIKTGEDTTSTTASQLKFAKEAVKGEMFFNTATTGTLAGKLFIASTTADGNGNATLVQIN